MQLPPHPPLENRCVRVSTRAPVKCVSRDITEQPLLHTCSGCMGGKVCMLQLRLRVSGRTCVRLSSAVARDTASICLQSSYMCRMLQKHNARRRSAGVLEHEALQTRGSCSGA